MNLTQQLITEDAQKSLRLAEQLALEYSHYTYGPEHLLWTVVDEDVGLSEFLQSVSVEATAIRKWVSALITKLPKDPRYVSTPKPNEAAQNVMQETQKLCVRYGHDEISPLDILEALVTPGVAFEEALLRRFPLALYEIIENRSGYAGPSNSGGTNAKGKSSGSGSSSDKSILEKYCEDLTEMGRQGKIDPVLGRDKELKQMVEILGKRISPNVMIVGEPGVGKTSVVGGLVNQIQAGKVPPSLKNTTIYELDVSGRLVAGAFKGEVEERLKSIVKAVKAQPEKAILFVDEIHILLDEKGPVGSGVVNILKPELSRGEITLIGATTQTEYQKYIEKDTAFSRRFSKLTIEEPDEITANKMLVGLVGKYEEFHGIKISREALPSAVSLAKKYIKDKHLPASAIELMDFAMSCAVQMNATAKDTLVQIETELSEEDANHSEILDSLNDRMSELLLGRLTEEDQTIANLQATVDKLKEWTVEAKEEVDATDIEATTSYKSGMPIGSLKSNEQEKLQNMESILRKRVVGQDDVVDAVSRGIKAFRTNLKEPNEPGAIFFFTGPTGTGKTELAKAIAELLFDDEDAMLRFDMSEFQESHSVATLLGAPPGYAGYDAGGILVNNVRKKPYSVVLFDEIEKAHEDIYGIFLQMLTDGRLQDKKGKMADFSNVIVIFTSNAGAHEIVDRFNKGENPSNEDLKIILRESGHFKDEFLGRVDSQILPFRPISEGVARMILDIHYNKFVRLLDKQHQITLSVNQGVKDHLIEIGFSPIFGARPLKSAIKSFLTPPMATKIIMGEVNKGDKVDLDIDENKELVWIVNDEGPVKTESAAEGAIENAEASVVEESVAATAAAAPVVQSEIQEEEEEEKQEE